MSANSAELKLCEIIGDGDGIEVCLGGNWSRAVARAEVRPVLDAVQRLSPGGRVRFSAAELARWDTTLVAFLVRVKKICDAHRLQLDSTGLPDGAARLLRMATAVPEKSGARRDTGEPGLFEMVGTQIFAWWHEGRQMVIFTGEVVQSFCRLLTGRAQMQWTDVLIVLEQAGPAAFPIVTLIAALMGIILAFVGAVQLRMFGAEIYVADLVAIGIVRELGAVMTGIVMAGRTGASYAASIGTMQVNEEIDAFSTMGISPVDFLVLPRTIGLVLMMPLLCMYANVMGLLGGMFIGVFMLDLAPVLYFQQTQAALSLNHLAVGLVMSVIFGFLVAFFGCLRGIRCGRSASSVGEATTSAVVSSIVSIVIATALVTVLADLLGV